MSRKGDAATNGDSLTAATATTAATPHCSTIEHEGKVEAATPHEKVIQPLASPKLPLPLPPLNNTITTTTTQAATVPTGPHDRPTPLGDGSRRKDEDVSDDTELESAPTKLTPWHECFVDDVRIATKEAFNLYTLGSIIATGDRPTHVTS